jgi:mycofactocin precursor
MADNGTELLDRADRETPSSEITDIEPDEVIAADLLVEEVSIDGMCGVY